MKRDIVERYYKPGAGIIRKLSCGHEVLEPRGGEASSAHVALCKQCKAEKTSEVRP